MHLSRGITIILDVTLNAALRQLNSNHHVAACISLNVFIHQVHNAYQANGRLTSQQAADLKQQATSIKVYYKGSVNLSSV